MSDGQAARRQGVRTLNRRFKLSRIESLVSVGREIMSLWPKPVTLAKNVAGSPSCPALSVLTSNPGMPAMLRSAVLSRRLRMGR